MKLLLVLYFATIVFAVSHHRYTNRMLKPLLRHQELRKRSDCFFNICEDFPNYPDREVKQIVTKHKNFHSFLNGRIIEPVSGISVSRRNDKQEKTFCNTIDVIAAPKLMLDVDNIRRHIVNLKNYTQILKFQTCDYSRSEECFQETLLNMKTKCMQKFNNIKLVTVDVDGGFLEYRIFKIPTTCVCTYSKEM